MRSRRASAPRTRTRAFCRPRAGSMSANGPSAVRLDAGGGGFEEGLAQTHCVGLPSNVHFLRRVARSASFAGARLDTALIAREQAALFHQEPVGLPLATAAAVAQTLLRERA